ncbi:MAG TPA: DUF2147 domain-containing protein [Syntrophales bacterium]|nr:DUF2147 domain-containing protein [Syntrophales bacterium]HOL59355.1 DUF2147 domain-containing protein [Syntrophales bacterium]HPO35453.1 DUF2147 domain-containing protein [Syntrophales bacterium]
MKKLWFVFPLVIVFIASLAFAQSPIGQWKTIDKSTKQEKSIVEIYESNGMLFGKIIRLPQEKDGGAGVLCTKCEGEEHNKPVVGMVIIKNMKKEGDQYTGGTVLDPDKGKTYKCKIKVIEGGQKLEVKGCIGFLCKATYDWVRVK